MRFSLQDVKKQVHRHAGELYVSLHFLHPGELEAEIESLIAYYEQHLHQPQRRFSFDDARACIGDYRLANCLIATLSAWYEWRQPDWTETLQKLGNADPLQLAGITSPVHLRLALFNYVNEYCAGFLDTNTRAPALQVFAQSYQFTVPDLEYLLALDSDEEAVLAREASRPPTAQEVATLYNQWAFEAALFNASSVHFAIDCNAFVDAQEIALRIGTGIGAVIKRLCYLARRMGVYYDLAYDSAAPIKGIHRDKSRVYEATRQDVPILHLTLYGPQEMTGLPQQYGLRLARLCRALLDYGVSPRQRAKGISLQGIVEADATVHFLQRSYRFVMDAHLLQLLPSASTPERGVNDAVALFDSSIEQSFAEAFQALQSSQGADGWQLEREPEPLLLDQGIFIPDFALTRGNHRIYVEILGFWTPAYRERKIAKLQQLAGRNDLVLAIPVEAYNAFASIASAFPIVWYDDQLSATDLLHVLRSQYDDFDERLALIDITAVWERVRTEGLLTERACYSLLHCYRRSELQRAAEHVIGEEIAFTVGIGLYSIDWLEHLHHSFVEWIGESEQPSRNVEAPLVDVLEAESGHPQTMPLQEVLHEMRVRWPMLATCEDATLEALLSLWPEVRINRNSIFETVVEFSAGASFASDSPEASVEVPPGSAPDNTGNAPRPRVRERRAAYKKQTVKETSQQDLWT